MCSEELLARAFRAFGAIGDVICERGKTVCRRRQGGGLTIRVVEDSSGAVPWISAKAVQVAKVAGNGVGSSKAILVLCCCETGLSRAMGRQEMISSRGTRTGVAACQLVKRRVHSGKGRPGSDDSHSRPGHGGQQRASCVNGTLPSPSSADPSHHPRASRRRLVAPNRAAVRRAPSTTTHKAAAKILMLEYRQ